MKPERHENADMICAKANDMNLVVLANCKASYGECWIEVEMESLSLHAGLDFFLCLPQHKEACLHWLNGWEVLIERKSFNGDGDELPSEGFLNWDRPSREWRPEVSFMNCNCGFKIKPKKEKRWIICSPKHNDVNETLFDYKPDMNSFGKYCQLIEIEVEV